MKSESAVLACFSDEIAKRISRKVVPALKAITDTLSGDDSRLQNVWEEICVQVQLEHSYFWEAYEEVLDRLIEEQLEKLQRHEFLALWFQTDAGMEWRDPYRILSGDDAENEDPPALVDDVVKYIANTQLYERAERYSNRNIRAYLEKELE